MVATVFIGSDTVKDEDAVVYILHVLKLKLAVLELLALSFDKEIFLYELHLQLLNCLHVLLL